ncbi:sulfatase-like hydrolase/transferase [Puniceicoccales bacterium CK1056]|uniref:Sulfatase-like hydrolase/transferase n=1 Tax=Oceanipulchritudo coccoides TaxID=2706888 RepID=A0A6B2M1W9_9BACT|nr:sulfatase-like hydrolase/transferase [Oceanipulchritudo coccoides]NDV62077.1 sulfatase-like hydrolase/transferase [Oceanipulchritudo coccoides]
MKFFTQSILMGLLLPLTVSAADQPNILFILTDDQGYGDVQKHGHPYLETPHIDRLHDESVRFDNFYVSPSCSPTRAALMTGMHEFRNGVTHTLQPREHLYKDAVILPQLLKTAGYRTGFIGKWHIGGGPGYNPENRGFDWTSTNRKGPRNHFDVDMVRNGKPFKAEGYREDTFFDEAMTFIEESGDQPFFCYLATYSPHTPLAAPEEFIEPFRKDVNEKHATYLGMVANIDYNVGRILEFLEEKNLDQNTIIIFMNDNGETEGLDVYNAHMRGCKCTIWEGGSRAMSFWRWPGKWRPAKVDKLTAHLDVLPTLCDLAGVNIPEELQPQLEGYSLIPLLESEDQDVWTHNDRILFHHVARWPSGLAASHKYAMAAARRGDHLLLRSNPCIDPKCEEYQSQCTTLRLVQNGLTTTTYTNGNAQFHWGVSAIGQWALYNVKDDPACETDLAAEMPELTATLATAYDTWWDDVFPVMIARGGDEGDPNASRRAAAKDKAPRKTTPTTPAKAGTVPASVNSREAAMFNRMDANADGIVTKEEYVTLFQRNFPNMDSNGDGVLVPAEFPYPPSFKIGDTDMNGSLDPQEFEGLYSRQFDGRDDDGNGVLIISEM